MQAVQNKHKDQRGIAAIIALGIFSLIVVLLIILHFKIQNPPFPEAADGGSDGLALGTMDAGNDFVEYGSLGKVTDVVAEEAPTKPEEIINDPNSNIEIKEEKKTDEKKVEDKPKIEKNTTVITPVKPKTAAELLAEKFKKESGKNGGGIGDNKEAGQNGSPDGDPFKNGNGGNGTGKNPGDGGDGPGGPGGGGTSKYGVSLSGRKLVTPPKLPNDTKVEGKVVVEITVDAEGNVIEANPNGRGTTTNDFTLKQKAMKAAMATKFNVDGKFEEQHGTITFIFAFD